MPTTAVASYVHINALSLQQNFFSIVKRGHRLARIHSAVPSEAHLHCGPIVSRK